MMLDASIPQDLKAWTKTLVTHYGLRAGQRLGQHFLVDRRVLQDIVAAAQLSPRLPVLEVGGGLGVLTLALLAAGAQVVTVELDKRLVPGLKKLAAGGNLTVIEGDILKLKPTLLAQALGLAQSGQFAIVANLPYEISGAFLRRFLSGSLLPTTMTVLLQREVAERLGAKPGHMSLLALATQLAAKVSIVRRVPPQAFWPPPKVESALVRFELKSADEREASLAGVPEPALWRVARIGFAARRKVLKNNLVAALPLSAATLQEVIRVAKLTPQARAQELSLVQWVALTRALAGAAAGKTTVGKLK